MKRMTFAIAGVVLLATMGFMGTAEAQYPTVLGRIIGNTSSTIPVINGNVTLTCQVQDVSGVFLTNQPCTFTILSEPGGPNGNAALGSKTVTKNTGTEAIARANLFVGDRAGPIVVGVTSGSLSSSITVSVQPSGSTAVIASVPAASTGAGTIRPPSTGDAGLVERSAAGPSAALLVVTAIASIGVASLLVERKLAK